MSQTLSDPPSKLSRWAMWWAADHSPQPLRLVNCLSFLPAVHPICKSAGEIDSQSAPVDFQEV